MKRLRWKRLFLFTALAGCIAALATILICNHVVSKAASGKLFSDVNTAPYNKVGLLLGTSKYLQDHATINPYYAYRIEAAKILLQKDKIKYLIISGDNSRSNYNEPLDMRNDLLKEGIDSNRIYLDYAGFRTFDSMIRLKDVFGQNSVTVISQKFHNERALYIASRNGISAIGFNANDRADGQGWRVNLREKLARVKLFIDEMVHAKPKFLGEKIVLPD